MLLTWAFTPLGLVITWRAIWWRETPWLIWRARRAWVDGGNGTPNQSVASAVRKPSVVPLPWVT